MDILTAMKSLREQPTLTMWRWKWVSTPDGKLSRDGERDYTIPDYISYSPEEDAFLAHFTSGIRVVEGMEQPVMEEDFMSAVFVTMFSVTDILADDWGIGEVRCV